MNDDELTPNQRMAATKISDVLMEYFMDADVGNIEDGECVVLLAANLLQSGKKAIGIDDMRKILDEVFWKEFTAIVTPFDLIKLVAISNQLLRQPMTNDRYEEIRSQLIKTIMEWDPLGLGNFILLEEFEYIPEIDFMMECAMSHKETYSTDEIIAKMGENFLFDPKNSNPIYYLKIKGLLESLRYE